MRTTASRRTRTFFGWLTILLAGFALGSVLSQAARAAEPPAPATAAAPAAPQAVATPDTPAGRQLAWFLRAVNTQDTPGLDDFEARFTPEFLQSVPALQLLNTTKALRMQLGALELRAIDERSPHGLVATLHAAALDAPFALSVNTESDEPFRMNGLLLRPLPKPAPAGDSWEKIDQDLEQLGEIVSFAAMRINADAGFVPVHMLYEDRAHAIGSTFKLWILGALGESVRDGALRFDDTLAIRDDWKSLPSGVMQLEPAGKEFPLREYAAKMISISDNTATDHLLHLVGREKTEAFMRRFVKDWERNAPFLSTRDMFAMKLGEDETLAERYLAADVAGRRAMLDSEVAAGKMNLLQAWITPRHIDTLEWFATAEELCATIAWLAREGDAPGMEPVMGAMSLNPGIPLDRAVWSNFAYKGGSEPGVMNMTWWLLRHDGVAFALSVGVNDAARPINETAMVEIAQRAVALLQKWEK